MDPRLPPPGHGHLDAEASDDDYEDNADAHLLDGQKQLKTFPSSAKKKSRDGKRSDASSSLSAARLMPQQPGQSQQTRAPATGSQPHPQALVRQEEAETSFLSDRTGTKRQDTPWPRHQVGGGGGRQGRQETKTPTPTFASAWQAPETPMQQRVPSASNTRSHPQSRVEHAHMKPSLSSLFSQRALKGHEVRSSQILGGDEGQGRQGEMPTSTPASEWQLPETSTQQQSGWSWQGGQRGGFTGGSLGSGGSVSSHLDSGLRSGGSFGIEGSGNSRLASGLSSRSGGGATPGYGPEHTYLPSTYLAGYSHGQEHGHVYDMRPWAERSTSTLPSSGAFEPLMTSPFPVTSGDGSDRVAESRQAMPVLGRATSANEPPQRREYPSQPQLQQAPSTQFPASTHDKQRQVSTVQAYEELLSRQLHEDFGSGSGSGSGETNNRKRKQEGDDGRDEALRRRQRSLGTRARQLLDD
ncbi:hypothetical protein GGR56DRAFT_161049 [Xylariaceae sp. FL0804]|nr:hypothetical protein GGR56DRAFT_161049 [Xylariaceae sp. FL0804]